MSMSSTSVLALVALGVIVSLLAVAAIAIFVTPREPLGESIGRFDYVDAFGHPASASVRVVRRKDPQIRVVENFLSTQECAHLVSAAESRSKRSTVIADDASIIDKVRTSHTATFVRSEDAVVSAIEDRTAYFLGVDPRNVEPPQVVTYRDGQEYRPHLDGFDPRSDTVRRCGNRKYTVLCYLNEVPKGRGGETRFPLLRLGFRPRTGTALVWDNLYADGTPDPRTLHAGMPVRGAYKAAVNVWVREKEYVGEPSRKENRGQRK